MRESSKKQALSSTAEFLEAINDLANERHIDREMLYTAIEQALMAAYKRNFGTSTANMRVSIDRTRGEIEVYARKTVVEEATDPQSEISLEAARAINPIYGLGDLIEEKIEPKDFGRIAAQTAKQVVVQKIREAERGGIYNEYIEKENEILTAVVQRVENKEVYVELGRAEGVLEASQQMPGEVLHPNDRVKVYVLEVNKTNRGPQIMVSRVHSGLIKRLFEIEVPEIQSGVVQIKSIAREAGSRTKMAVFSTDLMVDPVGACVGPRGMRVENVVNELKTEKIDIIRWSSDPAEYIASALNPARVLNVAINEKEKTARIVVPDNQLSLAIGKEGQNARLAAKLTGWKIDIKSQSQMAAAIEEAEEAEGAEQDAADPAPQD